MVLRLPQDPVFKKRLLHAMHSSYLRSLPVSERQKWMKAAKACRTFDDLPSQMQMHLLRGEEELLEKYEIDNRKNKKTEEK